MKTETLQYAPRTLVMLYFSDKVCGALDYEQLAALGSKITNPFLKGTRGISRTCLGAIQPPVWQALHDQGGTVLSDFLKDIPPTSFTGMNAAVPSTVSGIVKAKLTPKQKIEFDKTGVSNPCPFGLLDLPLENLATCDLDDVCKARLELALKNENCIKGDITEQFFIITETLGQHSHKEQHTFLIRMLKDMGENIQHIPTEAFQGLKYDDNDCTALVAATKQS